MPCGEIFPGDKEYVVLYCSSSHFSKGFAARGRKRVWTRLRHLPAGRNMKAAQIEDIMGLVKNAF
jgi:hypothetical protein